MTSQKSSLHHANQEMLWMEQAPEKMGLSDFYYPERVTQASCYIV